MAAEEAQAALLSSSKPICLPGQLKLMAAQGRLMAVREQSSDRIVSSSENPVDINRAYELGANAYMIKPMEFRAVEHLFQSTVGWRRRRRRPRCCLLPNQSVCRDN